MCTTEGYKDNYNALLQTVVLAQDLWFMLFLRYFISVYNECKYLYIYGIFYRIIYAMIWWETLAVENLNWQNKQLAKNFGE